MTTSPPSSAIRRPKLPSASSASRSATTVVTRCQAPCGVYGSRFPGSR
ncbi:hypothetical protein ACFQQB_21485 [Nonomuraea rubra]